MELLRAKDMTDVTVLIGGIIPEADIADSKKVRHRRNFSSGDHDSGHRRFSSASASQ